MGTSRARGKKLADAQADELLVKVCANHRPSLARQAGRQAAAAGRSISGPRVVRARGWRGNNTFSIIFVLINILTRLTDALSRRSR